MSAERTDGKDPAVSAGEVRPGHDLPWSELDRRSPAVTALLFTGVAFGGAVPIAIGMRGDGRPVWLVLALLAAGLFVVGGVAALGDRLRWRHTRYRVTDERVELRFTWVIQRFRSVPRDRIRTVDLTANPLLRLFGVVKVQIGTGQQAGEKSQLVLNPLDRGLAERLRAELLTTSLTPVATGSSEERRVPLAELDWSWIRFAPISVTTPVLGAAAFGGVLQASDWFGLRRTLIGEAGHLLRGLPILVTIAILVLAGVAVGVFASLGLFVELWWRYRLTREDGMLRVRRGLLTTRSLSLDERRLRGVEVVEPFGARLLGAARLDAVATGIHTKGDNGKSDPTTLLPPAPRLVVHRLAAEVLGADESPTMTARLRQHPPAARRRRVRWALVSVLLPAVLLGLLGVMFINALMSLALVFLIVGLPIALMLARDAYRNLGHGISDAHLVTRFGAGSRRTVVLQRTGVIGWTITSSPFQRRSGLLTVAATTGANKGSYLIRDVGEAEGLTFAAEVVPDLLAPFLDHRKEF